MTALWVQGEMVAGAGVFRSRWQCNSLQREENVSPLKGAEGKWCFEGRARQLVKGMFGTVEEEIIYNGTGYISYNSSNCK